MLVLSDKNVCTSTGEGSSDVNKTYVDSKIRTINRLLEDIESKITSNKNEISENKDNIKISEEELEKKYSKVEDDLNEEKGRLTMLKDELKKSNDEIKLNQLNMEEKLKKTKDEFDLKHLDIEKDLNKSRGEIDSNKKQLQLYEEKLKAILEKIELIGDIKGDENGVGIDISQFKDQFDAIKTEIKTRCSQLENNIRETQKEIDVNKQNLTNHENQIKAIVDDFSNVRIELDSTKNEINDEVIKLKEEFNSIQNELNAKYSEVKNSLDEVVSEVGTQRERGIKIARNLLSKV